MKNPCPICEKKPVVYSGASTCSYNCWLIKKGFKDMTNQQEMFAPTPMPEAYAGIAAPPVIEAPVAAPAPIAAPAVEAVVGTVPAAPAMVTAPVAAVSAAPDKKPKMTLKAKKEALQDMRDLLCFRAINDENYSESEGLDRLMRSLQFEIAKAEAKK